MDFRDPFKRFDVVTELGMDPELLLEPTALHKWLDDQIDEDEPMNLKQKFDHLIETKIEPRCDAPSFILNHPMIMSPLAKSHAMGRGGSVDPKIAHLLAERFELFIGGMEIANAYSEQNDAEK